MQLAYYRAYSSTSVVAARLAHHWSAVSSSAACLSFVLVLLVLSAVSCCRGPLLPVLPLAFAGLLRALPSPSSLCSWRFACRGSALLRWLSRAVYPLDWFLFPLSRCVIVGFVLLFPVRAGVWPLSFISVVLCSVFRSLHCACLCVGESCHQPAAGDSEVCCSRRVGARLSRARVCSALPPLGGSATHGYVSLSMIVITLSHYFRGARGPEQFITSPFPL